MTEDRKAEFLRNIAACATVAEQRTGFPAQVTVSQACAESAWGVRQTGDNNYFGLTRAVAPNQLQKLVPTHERLTLAGIAQLPDDERATITRSEEVAGHPGLFDVQLSRNFPSFASLQEAVDCYVNLLTTRPRYANTWEQWQAMKDIGALIDGIAAAGYATGGGYAALVKRIAGQPNVARAIVEARTA